MALTWFDARDGNTEVYLFAGPANELTSEIGSRAQRVTDTRGESIGAYLAWNGTRIGLAWCDDTVGQHEIYFQAFDRRGRATTAIRRVTDNTMSSLIPAIEPWRDGFALAWSEFVPATRRAWRPIGDRVRARALPIRGEPVKLPREPEGFAPRK